MRTVRRIGAASVVVVAILGSSAAAGAQASGDLPDKARAVFKAYCYRCHGQNGANEGGVNYILDLKQIVGRRKVVAGQSARPQLLLLRRHRIVWIGHAFDDARLGASAMSSAPPADTAPA